MTCELGTTTLWKCAKVILINRGVLKMKMWSIKVASLFGPPCILWVFAPPCACHVTALDGRLCALGAQWVSRCSTVDCAAFKNLASRLRNREQVSANGDLPRDALHGAVVRPVYSDTTQLNSTQLDVELSCVAINGPLAVVEMSVRPSAVTVW